MSTQIESTIGNIVLESVRENIGLCVRVPVYNQVNISVKKSIRCSVAWDLRYPVEASIRVSVGNSVKALIAESNK